MKPKIVFSVTHKKKPIGILYFNCELAAHQYMDDLKKLQKSGIINIDLVVQHPDTGSVIIRSETIKD